MKNLTVRNLPRNLASALDKERRERGLSLNATVIQLLGSALGVNGTRSNGLAKLAGDWSEEDQREFETAIAPLEQIDEDMWK